jgi:hypothetical protein
MRRKVIPASCSVWLSTMVVLLACFPSRAEAAGMKFQATLVWGTDDAKPPEGKDYKPVEAEIRKKLKELPLKWANWFEVNRKDATAAPNGLTKVPMSEKCELEVKNLDGSSVEVSLIGKGKEVMKRRQTLPKGEILVLGGNAPNSTAWLVVLKRIE